MPDSRAELLQEHIDAFPILPTTATRVMQVTSNPESSAQDLMEAILPDQALCVTVLKLANSVLFGRPKKVDSIKLAITVLGFDEVQAIALSKAMINSFNDLAWKKKTNLDAFWKHSLLTGLAARRIAQHLRSPLAGSFIAGLIHDIGKLVMLMTFESEYAPAEWLEHFSTVEQLAAEQKRFVFTHDIVGGELLKKWAFPDNLLAAVTFHHCPEDAGSQKGIATIVQLADLLAHCCNFPEMLEGQNITHCIQQYLPNLASRWLALGYRWDDEVVQRWYQWLLNNHQENDSIRTLFLQ